MPEGIPTIQPAKTTEYTTPRDLFDKLWDEVGGFDLDPCCWPDHYTAQRVLENGGMIYVPPELAPPIPRGRLHVPADRRFDYDGLAQSWHGRAAFMNPPYGPALRQWVPKAVDEVERGNIGLVMALLPAKTEVQWWQNYVITRTRREPGNLSGYTYSEKHPLVADVRFIKGRLSFGGGDGGPARVGNVIVVWRK